MPDIMPARSDVGRLAAVTNVADVPSGDAPIGVFDSGVGGLTVARAMLDLLPHEPLYYVADTANFPYGPKSDRRGAPVLA